MQAIDVGSDSDSSRPEDSSTSACQTEASFIKKQFGQIQKTETKLNNKISQYIKAKGPSKFVRSQYVVTSRQRKVVQPEEQA